MNLLKTICVAALLLTQSSISLAQDNRISRGTWDDVKAIPIGEKLEVRLQTGKTEKGTLSAVSDTGLNISLDRATINVNRDNVRQLHRVVRGSSKKSAIVGAVAGAATVGVGLGTYMGASDAGWDDGAGGIFGLLVAAGAGAGALVGHVIGKNRTRKVLVYESQ